MFAKKNWLLLISTMLPRSPTNPHTNVINFKYDVPKSHTYEGGGRGHDKNGLIMHIFMYYEKHRLVTSIRASDFRKVVEIYILTVENPIGIKENSFLLFISLNT